MMNRLFNDDSGFSMVLALSVAFIIFALGAVWVVTSNHELDEVLYSENRAGAQTSAEAGARYAMAALADDIIDPTWIGVAADNSTTQLTSVGLRTAMDGSSYAYVASGTSDGTLGSTCELTPHRASAAGEQLGEWWVRITAIDASTWLYQVESWGWGPSSLHRQHVVQKVSIRVALIPDSSGFTHALFAESHMTGLNRKVVYGDVYAGDTADLSQWTSIYANDVGYPGLGRLRVDGDLLIPSGSNNYFQGRVDVQGIVRDNKSGSEYADLWVRNDESADLSTNYLGDSDFNKADVSGEAKFREGTWSGTINGTVVLGATMNDVPSLPLPEFVWSASDYASATEYVSVEAFETWFAANEDALVGVHYVPGQVDLDFKNTRMTGGFMVVSNGSMSVTKMPSTAPSAEPMTIVLVQLDPEGRLTTANQVTTADGVLHALLFSNGEFDAAQQTTIHGAIYGHEDISANRVEVHFRPPDESLLQGFDFSSVPPTSFTAQPLVWRALSVNDPTPITDYCGVPGGAAAAVPPPGSTTTTTSPSASTTPSATIPTLPQELCVAWSPQGKCTQWG